MTARTVSTKPRLLAWLGVSAAALGLGLVVLSVTVDDDAGGTPEPTAGDTWQRLAPPPAAGSAPAADAAESGPGSDDVVLTTAAGRLLAVTGSEVRTFEGEGRGRWSPAVPIPGGARTGATVVGTPDAVIVWGGRTRAGLQNDGFAYVPGAEDWQRLPDSPLGARQGARGIWTGRVVVIVGGGVDSAHTAVETAAYDPARQTWRPLRDADRLAGSALMATAWAGDQVVVWAYHEDTADDDLLALDPDADPAVWSTLESPPFLPTVRGAGLAGDQVGLVATATGIGAARAAVLPSPAPQDGTARWQPVSSPPVPPGELCPSDLEHGEAGTILLSVCSDELFLLEDGDEPTWRRLPSPDAGAPDAGPGQVLVTDEAVYYLAPATAATAPSLLRLALP